MFSVIVTQERESYQCFTRIEQRYVSIKLIVNP